MAGALNPLSQLFYGSMLDEINREEIDDGSVKLVFFAYSLVLLLSTVFSFFERYLLGYFAGKC